jgi:hypothetical protein
MSPFHQQNGPHVLVDDGDGGLRYAQLIFLALPAAPSKSTSCWPISAVKRRTAATRVPSADIVTETPGRTTWDKVGDDIDV